MKGMITISEVIDLIFDRKLELTKNQAKEIFMIFSPGECILQWREDICYMLVKPLNTEFKIKRC